MYGSHLGASLASSLALTESHTHQPMAIRGLLAFNGIFNWTTLLPDHPNNNLLLDDALDMGTSPGNDKDVGFMKELMPSHFHQPANLFDPFASPVLFFHTAGMLVPTSFTKRSLPYLSEGINSSAQYPFDQAYVYSDPEDPPPPPLYEEIDAETETEDTNTDTSSSADGTLAPRPKPPRKGYVTFPPRVSSLKIPETLLMHTTPPPVPGQGQGQGQDQGQDQGRRTAQWERLRNAENSFAAQALGLAGMMRRSVNLFELRERMKWDVEFGGWAGEAARRVQVEDVGAPEDLRAGEFGLGRQGEEVAARWLGSRIG